MQAAKAAKALRDVDLINLAAPRTAAEASIEAHEAWMANRYKSGGTYANTRRLIKRSEPNADGGDESHTAAAMVDREKDYDAEEGDYEDEEAALLLEMENMRRLDKEGQTRAEINEKNADLAATVQDKEELLLETAELQIENARNQAKTLQNRNDASRQFVRQYDVEYRHSESSGFTDDALSDQLQLILYPSDVRGYVNPVMRRSTKVSNDSLKNKARMAHNRHLISEHKQQQEQQQQPLLALKDFVSEGDPSTVTRTNATSLALVNGGLVIEPATTLDEDHTIRTAKELQRICEAITTGLAVPPVEDLRVAREAQGTFGAKKNNRDVFDDGQQTAIGSEDEEEEEEDAEQDHNDIANLNDLLEDGGDEDNNEESHQSKRSSPHARRRSSLSSVRSNEKAQKELAAFLSHDAAYLSKEGKAPKTLLPRDFHSALRAILELLCEFVLIKNRRIIAIKEKNLQVAKERAEEQTILKGLIAKTREEAEKEKERIRKMESLGLGGNEAIDGEKAGGKDDVKPKETPLNSENVLTTTAEIRRIRVERKAKDKALEQQRKEDIKADEAQIIAIKEKLVPLMSAFFPSATTVKQTAEDIAAAIQAELEAKERAVSRPPRPLSANPNSHGGINSSALVVSSNDTQQPLHNTASSSSQIRRPRSAGALSWASSTGGASAVSAASTTAAASAKGAVGLLVSLSLTSLTQLAVKMSGALNMSNVILAQVALTDEMFERGLFLAEGAREDLEAEVKGNRGENAVMSPARKAEAENKAAEQRIIETILSGSKRSQPPTKTTSGKPQSPRREEDAPTPCTPTSQMQTARPTGAADSDPSGLVDDTPTLPTTTTNNNNPNTDEEIEGTATKEVAAPTSDSNGSKEKSTPKPTDVMDFDWYEKVRLEYLKRLDVAMLVTKERLIQMMMMRDDPTDAVADLHKQQDEEYLHASIAHSERQRALRRRDGNVNGGSVGGANAVSVATTAGAQQPPNPSALRPHYEASKAAAAAAAAANNNNSGSNAQQSTGKRVSIQLSDPLTGNNHNSSTTPSPIATSIAVTVNGLTTGGTLGRTNTAASALRWKLEEQKRQAAKDHADASASIRGVFEKHHKYCYEALNDEFNRKNKVLSQIVDHDLPLLDDAYRFQKQTHETAMNDYAREQIESFSHMKILENEQQRLWIEVEEMLERNKPLQAERHRLVQEHLMRSDLEWERRRHFEEWCTAHSAHKKHLLALKELLEESNTVLQGCKDVHNGMARSIIESVTFQNVQSRRQSRRSLSSSYGPGVPPSAIIAHRKASLAASQAGMPPPPPPVAETIAQEVTRRMSRVLGEDEQLVNISNTSAISAAGGASSATANNNNNNTRDRPNSGSIGAGKRATFVSPSPSGVAGSAESTPSTHLYGVTLGSDGQPVRPRKVPVIPPLERLDLNALFDFEGLLNKEDDEAEDELARMLEEEEELFLSSDEDEGDKDDIEGDDDDDGANTNKRGKGRDAELEALLREAADGDNSRSDALALKALRMDHTHIFLSKLYAPFVQTTQELITRKNARLLIARKSVRLFDDLLGISTGSDLQANNNNNNNYTSEASVMMVANYPQTNSVNVSVLTNEDESSTLSIGAVPAVLGDGTVSKERENNNNNTAAARRPSHSSSSVGTAITSSSSSAHAAAVASIELVGEDRDRVRQLRREAITNVATLEREVLLLARRVELYQPMYECLIKDLAKRERRRIAKLTAKANRMGAPPPPLLEGGTIGRTTVANTGGSGDKTARPTSAPFTSTARNNAAVTAAAAAVEEQFNPLRSAQFEQMAMEVSKAVENIHEWDAEEDEALELQLASVIANYAIYGASEVSRQDQIESSPQRQRSVPRKRPVSAHVRNRAAAARDGGGASLFNVTDSSSTVVSNLRGVSGYVNYATLVDSKNQSKHAKTAWGDDDGQQIATAAEDTAIVRSPWRSTYGGAATKDTADATSGRGGTKDAYSALNRTAPAALCSGHN